MRSEPCPTSFVKTIIEVHMILRAALDLAVQRELLTRNVAASEQLKRPRAA